MKEMFKAISELKGNHRWIFLESILDDDIKANAFVFLLKNADEESQNYFFKDFPNEDIEWWKSLYPQVEDINEGQIKENVTKFKTFLANLSNVEKEMNDERNNKAIERREFLKSAFEHCGVTDKSMGIKPPPMVKEYDKNAILITLPKPNKKVLAKDNIFDCIEERKTYRKYSDNTLSIDELSYLLWATQGVRKINKEKNITYRNVPSGGERNPFETYLVIDKVKGIKKGIYRYLPLSHELAFLFEDKEISNKLIAFSNGQPQVGSNAVCFIWSTIPYRTEWKYTTESMKTIAVEAGHICQNLYLACTSINCGTNAIGSYNQKEMDNLLKLDGIDEFTVYLAPVGKV